MTGLKKRKALLMNLAERLELPEEAVSGATKLSVTGGKRILIENHRGILEYGSERIAVRTDSGTLILSGTELHLLGMNEQELLFGGRLQNVEWG